jgi:tetratricopeptide (TPR) repeat protein
MAEQDYDAALGIFRQLAHKYPTRLEFRQELATTHNSRGVLLQTTGRLKEAEQEYDAALSIFRQLAHKYPTRPEFRREWANSHSIRGDLLRATGRPKEAKQDYDAALRIRGLLSADLSNEPRGRSDSAGGYVNLAILHQKLGRPAAAKWWLLKGRPHLLAGLEANPRNPIYREYFRNHLGVLAEVHAGLLETDEAVRTAETRGDVGWDPPADACDAAGFLSLCIPIVATHEKLDEKQRKESAHFYTDAALKLLREAVGRGFKDAARLKSDPAFAALRENAEFREVLAELSAPKK